MNNSVAETPVLQKPIAPTRSITTLDLPTFDTNLNLDSPGLPASSNHPLLQRLPLFKLSKVKGHKVKPTKSGDFKSEMTIAPTRSITSFRPSTLTPT